MKISSIVLAAIALQPTAAFLVQGPAKSSTALGYYLDENQGPRDTRVPDLQRPQSTSGLTAVETQSNAQKAIQAGSAIAEDIQAKHAIVEASDFFGERDNMNGIDLETQVTVQGGSLRTWTLSPLTERVQVRMKTNGRPLNANIDIWQGPDNTPQRMAVYIEDGAKRPFNAVFETIRSTNAIAVYNTGDAEFPLSADVGADESGNDASGLLAGRQNLEMKEAAMIQGGALKSFVFSPLVGSVQVMLKTDGRPLNARIELLQGPNNNKQVMQLYSEDGLERPFVGVIETPGSGHVVRILNTSPVEFPLLAHVEPYLAEGDAMGFPPEIGMRN